MSVVDEVSPAEYGEDRITLTHSQDAERIPPRAFEAVTIEVDYSRAEPEGVVLPLEFTVSSRSGAATFLRKVLRRFAPSSLTFTPQEGGTHLVRLAEQHHNRWVGVLELDVEGSSLTEED